MTVPARNVSDCLVLTLYLRAVGLYEKAAETVSVEDRPNVAGEYMGKAGR